jgi:peptidoglycan/LPS O-acetylase OafA/YrhL
MKKELFPSLNGLRALSIIIVVLSHLKEDILEIPFLSNIFKYLTFLTDGQLGVNIFFVISGFLITMLLIREENYTGKIDIIKFYLRRLFRIFPAYYFLLLVYAILCVFNVMDIPTSSWLSAISFTKYFNWDLDWYTRHAWSLSIEEHFYLLWPIIFIFSKRIRLAFLFSIIMICPIFRVYDSLHETWMNNLTIFQRLDSIALGCLVAIYYDSLVKWIIKYKTVLITLSIFWILFYPYITPLNTKYSLHLGWFTVPFGNSIGTLTNITISIILIYSMEIRTNYFYRLLNCRPLNYIGLLSYSIYLWQQIFTSELFFGKPLFPFNLLLIVVFSLISYYFIEKPFLRYRNKFAI